MAAVGGMLAVVGLPAYAAMSENSTSANYLGTDADAQSMNVAADAAVTGATRDSFTATTPEELAAKRAEAERAAARSTYAATYLAVTPRDGADDYPWPYSEGLSPLNYYAGECVDFVAWRLNRDAGSTSAPFKWVWSNLTPTGGSAGQWIYAWQAHGWPVSSDPVPGAVAVTGYDHVAYVKDVLGDGNVLIEEYNYAGYHQYGQRILPASSVIAFLYPPG
jgi:surface antigen